MTWFLRSIPIDFVLLFFFFFCSGRALESHVTMYCTLCVAFWTHTHIMMPITWWRSHCECGKKSFLSLPPLALSASLFLSFSLSSSWKRECSNISKAIGPPDRGVPYRQRKPNNGCASKMWKLDPELVCSSAAAACNNLPNLLWWVGHWQQILCACISDNKQIRCVHAATGHCCLLSILTLKCNIKIKYEMVSRAYCAFGKDVWVCACECVKRSLAHCSIRWWCVCADAVFFLVASGRATIKCATDVLNHFFSLAAACEAARPGLQGEDEGIEWMGDLGENCVQLLPANIVVIQSRIAFKSIVFLVCVHCSCSYGDLFIINGVATAMLNGLSSWFFWLRGDRTL